MIGDPPEFEDGTSDKRFGGLLNTGFFDIVGIRGCVRWWVVVLESGNVDVVAVVRMLSPPKVHSFRIRVVKFVVCMCCPLDVDPGGFGTTETIVERDFDNGGIEVVI
ncbi:hypothetical protein G3A49_13500 [Haloferax volcanii]|uniref:Uncharacterized protein n=1 Tax=Haloferax volcanii TaxID=2246 RepID=A0A6C0V1B1_HALVO|nr:MULTISPECIES: hypothetical protein [Haloferax]QIB79048.1 hypothetical protein G3A49_13240 [Haloferax alexandrinus]QIB79088.1 hypothetical protein G3A49_13500 [Haloferax alexandrinus]